MTDVNTTAAVVNELLSSAEHGDRHQMVLTHYNAKITMRVAEVCMLSFALAAGMEHALSTLLLVCNKSLNCSNLFDCPHLAYGCLSVLLPHNSARQYMVLSGFVQ